MCGIALVPTRALLCGSNEVVSTCATPCPATCSEPNNICQFFVCNIGCVCKSGFIRESTNGSCIPEKDCPKCEPNQVWEKCSDNACKRTCENQNITMACPNICISGCSCAPGYVWNANLTDCISEDSCPKEWEQCSDNLCKKTCANKDLNEPCPQACIPGCSCKPGYVWNENLTECILACECPIECGPNQVWEECSDNVCRKTCLNRNGPEHCPLCPPGCSCKDGFVWNEDYSECIPIDECPPQCGTNQVWENCSDNACKRTCENRNKVVPCPLICEAGCSCKDGFVWNENLTECIPIDSCPIGCGTNQVYEECSDNNCKKTCATKNLTLPCPTICTPGCSCEEDYVWNNNLTECVPVDMCPEACGPHQVWEKCSDNACKKTCENKNISIPCPKICVPGCSCVIGYVWNSEQNGCISEDSCPEQCGDNQIYEECSDNLCKKTCANKDLNEPCPQACVPGCSCKSGYVWNENLTDCVLACECPLECGPNQVWEKCSDNACRKTCRNRNGPEHCPICPPGCSCKDGFVWNEDYSECIPIDECPPQCGTNQVWENCSDNACKRTCENRNKVVPCPLICEPGCSCKDGFVWNENLTECVPIDSCPIECGDNQIYEECSDNLCKKTCANKDLNEPCPQACVPGCSCKSGYSAAQTKFGKNAAITIAEKTCRNRNGPEHCPICPPGCSCIDGFVWNDDWAQHVYPLMSALHNVVLTKCGKIAAITNAKELVKTETKLFQCPLVCKPGCSCEDGFVWDKNLTECIPIDSCPIGCGTNQVYEECSDNNCKKTCATKNVTLPCPTVCTPGCSCEKNYVWNDNLTECVPVDMCPEACDQHQVWEMCSDNACKKTCENRNVSIPCPKICVPGCSCVSGYVWNSEQTGCVSEDSCPKHCGDNQEWEQCSDNLCKRTCANKDQNLTCPQICVEGCSCKAGYVWTENLTECIPDCECPEECGLNQIWEKCSDNNCRKTCQNRNGPSDCPPCSPGCSCKEGFVWNQDFPFVLQLTNVLHVKCGTNQVWENCSDNACKRTCDNKDKIVPCPLVCRPGCSCKDGYVWNRNLTECIAIDTCPTGCGTNQIYEECSDNNCKRTCSTKNATLPCSTICIPGCSCEKNYVWNDNFTECVPVDSCPEDCGPHQIWEKCSDNVCKRTCENRNLSIPCPKICVSGCSCVPGFVWNAEQTSCISEDSCPNQCGDNQEWEKCSDNLCKKTCSNKDVNTPCPQACIEGCSCKKGYVWTENLTECIPDCDCPIKCGPNQVFEQCSDNACKRTCENKDHQIICPAVCLEGCSCKQGYVWNEDLTTCIPIDSCPKVCRKNEVFEVCSNVNCRTTCNNINFTTTPKCDKKCTPGCSCAPGFVWNEKTKHCVCPNDCPPGCDDKKQWVSPCTAAACYVSKCSTSSMLQEQCI
ncbi:hypothetical protein FQR65_LT13240 [Abscondita terminalis]|nr:hypothetical protein FQR65_LT13240 [Abscondita terminalis]